MADTSSPSSCAEDSKKYVMKVFEEATKDCQDEQIADMLSLFADYNSLNNLSFKVLDSMAEIGMTDKAKEIFKPMANSGYLSPVAIFTIVLIFCSGKRNTKGALKVYQRMIAFGLSPPSWTYEQLIHTLATDFSNKKFLSYAKKYFLEMLDKGMKPNPTPFMDVMNAIAYQEPLEKAKEFLEQVIARGFVPAHNNFHHSEGHLAEKMQALKMYTNLIHNETVDTDIRSHFFVVCARPGHTQRQTNKMYTALVEEGNEDEATEFRNIVDETGVEPMVLIHTSVIKAYLKFGKTKGALEAYLAMLADGVAPNSYTYTILIKGLSADPNFFEDAKKYLLEMMDTGKRPNAATFTAVVEGFAKQEDKAAEEEGKEFVQVMIGKGFMPNVKAMREVLKGRPTKVIRSAISIVLSVLKH